MPTDASTKESPALADGGRERQRALQAEADRLYETYVKPLEAEHWGEFAVVAADGRMVIRSSELEALQEAIATLGRGHFLFDIGEVHRWRR